MVALVRQTVGNLAIPAGGLIPPGLLGYEPGAPAGKPEPLPEITSADLDMK